VRTSLPLIFAPFVLAACSDPTAAPEAPHIVALYGKPAETALSPYPSNRYTTADATTSTGLRVHIGADVTNDQLISSYEKTVEQLNEMDGFSTVGGVIVNFSGPIDAKSLVLAPEADPPLLGPILDATDYQKPGSPLYLVNVDENSPEKGQTIGLIPQWYAQEDDDDFPADYTLVAEPAIPLRQGTKYAFVVTNDLHAADGRPIDRSPDMEALLGAGAEGEYGTSVNDAVDEIEKSVGVARKDIILASVFTTATIRSGIEAMGIAARKAPTPVLSSPWEVQQGPEAGGRVRFKAVYDAPDYRGADTGTWSFENGMPVVQKTAGLEVFLAFSKAEVSGKRPVVIYGHGLGGDKDGTWGTADRLAGVDPNGVAVFGIDSPEHGSRMRDPNQNSLFAAFYFFGIDDKTQAFNIVGSIGTGKAHQFFGYTGSVASRCSGWNSGFGYVAYFVHRAFVWVGARSDDHGTSAGNSAFGVERGWGWIDEAAARFWDIWVAGEFIPATWDTRRIFGTVFCDDSSDCGSGRSAELRSVLRFGRTAWNDRSKAAGYFAASGVERYDRAEYVE
jgi:hypothetical protein